MASMREIKRRKGSISNISHITKAMKLVSTVKFQKAKNNAQSSKPYFDKMYQTVSSILAKTENINHPYLNPGTSAKKAIITITSNRGLAGGYNSNIIKLITGSGFATEDVVIYPIGRKGRDALERRGYEIKNDYSDAINAPVYRDALDIGNDVLKAFGNNEIGEIYLAYTGFKNTVTHVPQIIRLLPVEENKDKIAQDATEDAQVKPEGPEILMNYEPEPEEALTAIIPKYVCSLIYGALKESAASENGARMTAMDSATNNAEEMLEELTLSFNRARQSAITQEITEIVSGSEALA